MAGVVRGTRVLPVSGAPDALNVPLGCRRVKRTRACWRGRANHKSMRTHSYTCQTKAVRRLLSHVDPSRNASGRRYAKVPAAGSGRAAVPMAMDGSPCAPIRGPSSGSRYIGSRMSGRMGRSPRACISITCARTRRVVVHRTWKRCRTGRTSAGSTRSSRSTSWSSGIQSLSLISSRCGTVHCIYDRRVRRKSERGGSCTCQTIPVPCQTDVRQMASPYEGERARDQVIPPDVTLSGLIQGDG